MIISRHLPGEEGFFQRYMTLFVKTFGEYKPHRIPDWIYVVREGDEDIGFAEGFVRKPGECFLMFGGAPMHRHGMGANVRAYRAMLERLHEDGYESIMTEIENGNIGYLKLALSSGLRIIGARVASDRTVVLTLIKLKENEL